MTRATAAEGRYMGRVAALPCVLCRHLGVAQYGRTFVHHIKDGTGIGERQAHWLTVALCHEHHQGAGGVHGLGTKGFYTRYRMDELDLLALTVAALAMQGERTGFPTKGVPEAPIAPPHRGNDETEGDLPAIPATTG